MTQCTFKGFKVVQRSVCDLLYFFILILFGRIIFESNNKPNEERVKEIAIIEKIYEIFMISYANKTRF